jgi:hypothetical protein
MCSCPAGTDDRTVKTRPATETEAQRERAIERGRLIDRLHSPTAMIPVSAQGLAGIRRRAGNRGPRGENRKLLARARALQRGRGR